MPAIRKGVRSGYLQGFIFKGHRQLECFPRLSGVSSEVARRAEAQTGRGLVGPHGKYCQDNSVSRNS
jgi:hypothetical protein